MKNLLIAFTLFLSSCAAQSINPMNLPIKLERTSDMLFIYIQGSEIAIELEPGNEDYYFAHDGKEFEIEVSGNTAYFLGNKLSISQH
jgi:hypothetical protein